MVVLIAFAGQMSTNINNVVETEIDDYLRSIPTWDYNK